MTADGEALPFAGLSPEAVLDAVESVGLEVDGRLFALNSYENRVYRVGLAEPLVVEDERRARDAVVVKFYRAGRWSDAQIREEHAFAADLVAAELPVAAPLRIRDDTLQGHGGFRFAAFESWRGGAPELDAPASRELLGRTLGRFHARARTRRFDYRTHLLDDFGESAIDGVLAGGRIDPSLETAYAQVAGEAVAAIEAAFERAGALAALRLHGDCHLGNLLWDARGPVFVDLDDCCSGPAVQDLWMLVAGEPEQQRREWQPLIEGYEQFMAFDFREVALIEALRTLRMIRHAAWLAARWSDPAFPRAFPWFAERRFWEQHLADLREQLESIEDPPLLRSL
ncbi:MAG: serine/threonine protein kinase [Steroidobacteraceae bacterium]